MQVFVRWSDVCILGIIWGSKYPSCYKFSIHPSVCSSGSLDIWQLIAVLSDFPRSLSYFSWHVLEQNVLISSLFRFCLNMYEYYDIKSLSHRLQLKPSNFIHVCFIYWITLLFFYHYTFSNHWKVCRTLDLFLSYCVKMPLEVAYICREQFREQCFCFSVYHYLRFYQLNKHFSITFFFPNGFPIISNIIGKGGVRHCNPVVQVT